MHRVERKADGLRVAHLPDGLGFRRVFGQPLGHIRLGLLLQMRPQLTLEQKGYITARDEPSAAGRPRRYYHLTDAGRKRLQEKETEWNTYTRAVSRVLKGGAYGG